MLQADYKNNLTHAGMLPEPIWSVSNGLMTAATSTGGSFANGNVNSQAYLEAEQEAKAVSMGTYSPLNTPYAANTLGGP